MSRVASNLQITVTMTLGDWTVVNDDIGNDAEDLSTTEGVGWTEDVSTTEDNDKHDQ